MRLGHINKGSVEKICEYAFGGIVGTAVYFGALSSGEASDMIQNISWVACNIANPSYIMSSIKNVDKYLFD